MRSGSSSTQGGQVVAQKLTSTGRPRSDCRVTLLPSIRVNSVSAGTRGAGGNSQVAAQASTAAAARMINNLVLFFSLFK